jgi:hypothetical protein
MSGRCAPHSHSTTPPQFLVLSNVPLDHQIVSTIAS